MRDYRGEGGREDGKIWKWKCESRELERGGGGAIKRRDSTAGGRLSRGAPLDHSDLMAEVFPAQNLFNSKPHHQPPPPTPNSTQRVKGIVRLATKYKSCDVSSSRCGLIFYMLCNLTCVRCLPAVPCVEDVFYFSLEISVGRSRKII